MATLPQHDPGERMTQLDGLRAFAVVAVVVSHWTPDFLIGIVPWGTGVQLFFVLSGFLITGILLRSRPEDLGTSLWASLRTFYLRRALRIFPVYYGVLVFSLLFSVGPIRESWPWHVSYLSNFYYSHHDHGPAVTDPYLHFWSLAVEEQFYLVWPLLALTVSRRPLAVAICLAVVASTVFRVFIDRIDPSLVSIRYLTPSCLDALAIGALAAHVKHYKGGKATRRLAWIFACVGVGGLAVSVLFLSRVLDANTGHRIGHTFLVIFYGALVAGAATGFGGPLGRVLVWRPLIYLGTISYGIYVYHYFAPAALHWLGNRVPSVALQSKTAVLAAYTVFTLTLSVASWHLFEAPLNRLKSRLPYPRPSSGPGS